jgi:3-phosphoshikimate 1-carboxyvinyltransferase
MLELKTFKPAGNHIILSLTGSKSETNRLLILQALWPGISLSNLAECDDSAVMIQALKKSHGTIDVGHAGTAMRFLTAYFASLAQCSVVLTGSKRMKERPIGILVDALKALGADINYLGQEGYPPLAINGRPLKGGQISMSGAVSSQYLTALMLVATKFEQGLTINIQGGLTSLPYLTMTASMIQELGAAASVTEESIKVQGPILRQEMHWNVESDWSGASYWFSMVALNENWQVGLEYLNEKSLQGDRAIADLFETLGVSSEFDRKRQQVWLRTNNKPIPESISWDLSYTPDLAQTIAVCCFGLGIACHLTGLHTLKIKETDRLEALSVELTKLGAIVETTDHSLTLEARDHAIKSGVTIETYNDHRMAMAFAPLVTQVPILIEHPEVVSKSYPNFWKDMAQVGAVLSQGN